VFCRGADAVSVPESVGLGPTNSGSLRVLLGSGRGNEVVVGQTVNRAVHVGDDVELARCSLDKRDHGKSSFDELGIGDWLGFHTKSAAIKRQ
jgi:hypothetical protein